MTEIIQTNLNGDTLRRNLILITVDCLRGDRINYQGGYESITPRMDEMSKNGASFTKSFSVAPFTLSSMKSIFTSTYPLMNDGNLSLTKEMISFVEILNNYGYSTAGYHSNPWLTKLHNYNKGFDYFMDGIIADGKESNRLNIISKFLLSLNKKNPIRQVASFLHGYFEGTQFPYVRANKINEMAFEWLSNVSDSNFFIWMHYMDTHEPHLPINKYSPKISKRKLYDLNKNMGSVNPKLDDDDLEKLIGLYNAETRYVDEAIGAIYNFLKYNNLINNTYVIITADHGQQFMEHGQLGHGLYLYDELIHVPLIIIGPGIGEIKINEVISLIDLAPTILDLLGFDTTNSFKGKSLKPLLYSNEIIPTLTISEEARSERKMPLNGKLDFSQKKISLRTNKWKYIYNETKKHELYNLETDKYEKNNLIDLENEIANELLTKVLNHINNLSTSSKINFEKNNIRKKVRNCRKNIKSKKY
ncbi:MAG: sulfatase-like hydrolase/transferase [Candidatus Methanoperedens sp.]|nr:sulfatase-like hydrolase/transferase [Candidatus Methanoperedens sp.]